MGKKLTQEDIINRIQNKFGDKFDLSKFVYNGIDKKSCFICSEHGVFQRRINDFLKSKWGCPKCGYLEATKQITNDCGDFINKAKKIHDNKYDYSKVHYINSKIKVCIICPKHGEFFQEPKAHLKGQGCPKCSGCAKLTMDDFIEKARKVHGDEYDYSKVKYINNHTKVCIICPEHGEFWQTPNSHLNGNGCYSCKNKKISLQKTFTKEQFIEKAQEIHGGKYDYSKVNYINSHTKVCIICPTHGEFEQTPDKHINSKQGCIKCTSVISNNEKKIVEYCRYITNNIVENNRNILNGKELDIYLPEYNLAIEYNGLLWHSEKYGKDKYYHLNKLNLCNEQGIKLIQIFEDEYLEHKDIVLSKIKHILNKDTDLPKIQARKCFIREIKKEESVKFLEKNHIQGFASSTVYLGCFQDNTLVGVMTFKEVRKGNNRWELNRFATDITKRCVGVGGKLFRYFIKKYKPEYIKSFADRRWTLDKDNNLYTKLGFKLEGILKPDYHYFYNKGYGSHRMHKFNFRKQILMKKYSDKGLTMDMTEKEMCDKLGAYRIWDCGLFKFEWIK